MIEFIPYFLRISLSLIVGLVALFLYKKNGKIGLALFGVAFFLNAVPTIVNLSLGGPYLSLRLIEQGYTKVEVGIIQFYLLIFSSVFDIASAVLIIAGLIKIYA